MVFLFLLLISVTIGLANLPHFLASWSQPMHQACLAWVPGAQHRELYRALVCGADISSGDLAHALQQTGLLHIVVVSGSHLICLESLCRYIFRRLENLSTHVLPLPLAKQMSRKRRARRQQAIEAAVFGILILFIFATRFQPPVVRAALSLFLSSSARRFSLGWTPIQVALLSGLLCLALFPAWLGSFSLLLSWTAALALSAGRPGDSQLTRHARVYAFVFICLLPLTPPHPGTILCNWIAAPILGSILFPVTLAACICPPLIKWLDPVCTQLIDILQATALLFPSPTDGQPLSRGLLWSYLWSLHIALLKREIKMRRTS